MVGLNKFSDKERRKARRSFQSNSIAHDLGTPKYRQRVLERKRIEDTESDDGSYYFDDDYESDETSSG